MVAGMRGGQKHGGWDARGPHFNRVDRGGDGGGIEILGEF